MQRVGKAAGTQNCFEGLCEAVADHAQHYCAAESFGFVRANGEKTTLYFDLIFSLSLRSWRALQQQDSSFSLPLSRQLPSLSAAPLQSLSTQMHLIWSHLSSYCEARLPNASHVRLRVPKPGAQCYIELEVSEPLHGGFVVIFDSFV